MSPTVSVIIPVYNSELTLYRLLDSLKSQIYKKFEVIVVDDGSNDNSVCICNEFADSLDIYIYHTSHCGSGHARNYGIKIAKGKYVTFVDSDDYVEKNYLYQIVNYAEKYDLDLVFFNHVDESENRIIYSPNGLSFNAYSNSALKKYASSLLRNSYWHTVWNKLYLKDLIIKSNAKFNSEIRIGEDTCFNIDIYKNVERVGVIPDILYHYCLNKNSLLHSFKSYYYHDTKFVYFSEIRFFADWSDNCIPLINNDFLHHLNHYLISLFINRTSAKTKVIRQILSDIDFTYLKIPLSHNNILNFMTFVLLKTKCPYLILIYSYILYVGYRIKYHE